MQLEHLLTRNVSVQHLQLCAPQQHHRSEGVATAFLMAAAAIATAIAPLPLQWRQNGFKSRPARVGKERGPATRSAQQGRPAATPAQRPPQRWCGSRVCRAEIALLLPLVHRPALHWLVALLQPV